jgi:transposase-like protein
MTEHVGYEKHDAAGKNSGNSRNGKSAKTIKGSFGTMSLEVPRDRNGTFEPQIIEKHQTRLNGRTTLEVLGYNSRFAHHLEAQTKQYGNYEPLVELV